MESFGLPQNRWLKGTVDDDANVQGFLQRLRPTSRSYPELAPEPAISQQWECQEVSLSHKKSFNDNGCLSSSPISIAQEHDSPNLPAAALPFTLRSSSHAFSSTEALMARQEEIRLRIARLAKRIPQSRHDTQIQQEEADTIDKTRSQATMDGLFEQCEKRNDPEKKEAECNVAELKASAQFKVAPEFENTGDRNAAHPEISTPRDKSKSKIMGQPKAEIQREEKDRKATLLKAEAEVKAAAEKKAEVERKEEAERKAMEDAERRRGEAIQAKLDSLKELQDQVLNSYHIASKRLNTASAAIDQELIEQQMRFGFQKVKVQGELETEQKKLQARQIAIQEAIKHVEDAENLVKVAKVSLDHAQEAEAEQDGIVKEMIELMENFNDIGEQVKAHATTKRSRLEGYINKLTLMKPQPISMSAKPSLNDVETAIKILTSQMVAIHEFDSSVTYKHAGSGNGSDMVTIKNTIPQDLLDVNCTATAKNLEKYGVEELKQAEKTASAEQIVESKNRIEDEAAREDVETDGKLRFTAWPKTPERVNGAAGHRRVKLTNLPNKATFKSIMSLIWGGPVESLEFTPGNTFAMVKFMKPTDCAAFYEGTANGIQLTESRDDGGLGNVVWVEPDEGVFSINEQLESLIKNMATRVVRAVGVDSDWGMPALFKIASEHNRVVEDIVDGKNTSGLRTVEFRMANLQDAVRLKAELQRDLDWEHCNIYFSDDPCALRHAPCHHVSSQ